MRISTRKTLLRVATAAAIVCTGAVVLLPAGASQAAFSPSSAICDASLAIGCSVTPDIFALNAR